MSAVDEQTGAISVREERPLAEVSKGYTSFEEGDVLFAKITPCMENGKIAMARNLKNGIGRGSTEFHVLRPGDRVLGEYVYHFVRQKRFREDAKRNFIGTAGQQRVPRSFMENVAIPLPPLDEQRRIVDILNRAAKVERMRAQAWERLREFIPALFIGMLGDPVENPMGWKVVRIGEVADVVAGDPAPQDPRAFAPDGPLFVRMQDVGRHHVNPALSDSSDRLNSEWLANNRLRLFPKESILIPKSGASVNLNHRAKLANDAYVVSHLAVLVPNRSVIDPDYLFWWSVHYDPRSLARVTSLPSLKLTTLREATLPLPLLDDQRRAAKVLNRATKIEQSMTNTTQSTTMLRDSIMSQMSSALFEGQKDRRRSRQPISPAESDRRRQVRRPVVTHGSPPQGSPPTHTIGRSPKR